MTPQHLIPSTSFISRLPLEDVAASAILSIVSKNASNVAAVDLFTKEKCPVSNL